MRKINRIWAAILAGFLLLLTSPVISNAAVTPGTKCLKPGIQQVYKGKTYTCIKLGAKLYWNNGVVVKVRPSPTPTVTVTATPIPSPTPTKSVTPNKTKPVVNVVLNAGLREYTVNYDFQPGSEHYDVVIFESLSGSFTGEQKIVYVGQSKSVTILTGGLNAYESRWILIRTRDQYSDLNISEVKVGPVKPLNSQINTFIPPGVPTNVVVAAFNETSDPSNYTGYINVSWIAPVTGAKGYNVGVWESAPGVTLPSREFNVEGTSSKIDGLFVGKSYYIQVKALSEFGTPSAWAPPALNYPVIIPANTAIPGPVTILGK